MVARFGVLVQNQLVKERSLENVHASDLVRRHIVTKAVYGRICSRLVVREVDRLRCDLPETEHPTKVASGLS